jgi:hypothetical protein
VRRALNDNPIAQIAVLGLLAVVVAFLLMTRVLNKSSESSTTPATPATGTPTATATTDGSTAPAVPGATTAPATGSTVAPSDGSAATTSPAVPGAVAPSAGTAAVSSKLVAGPGLPKPVAKAYADDKAIVLLVFRRNGIDDAAVRTSVERLRGHPGIAVFVTEAGRIARYSRITEGLDVNRVPALIVVRPRRLAHGVPTATVSYGFQGPASVEQAVRDGLYTGPSDLPYYPR